MALLLIVVVGVLVGAVVNRLGTDLPARHPPRRPRCPYCGHPRPWYHWVALPAYIVGRARCPHCSAPISIRYPLTELTLGFLFGYLYLHYGPTPRFGFLTAYTTIFSLVAITDLERRLILNVVILPAMGLAIVGSFFTDHVTWWSALLGGLIGYLFFLVAALAGNLLVGPGALGGGDVKLAGFVGLVVGFPLIIEALVLTILGGGLISLLLLVTRLRSLRDPIPYGPFLIIGGWVTMLWGMEIARWLLYRA
ncbi:MAG TPA: prepilin peptidase [Anaerolineales bacterium]|nr:prepilin peptidase [Anaerolineales bacterium]